MRNKKLIFIAPARSTFVLDDIAILSDQFQVKVNIYQWYNRYLVPLLLVRQLLYLLINIRNTSIMVVSFGGYWALLPVAFGKLFKIPVYIILHGTDCASIPDINYGSLRKYLVRKICSYAYKHAYKLLPVSESLIRITNTYRKDDQYPKQGFMSHFPALQTKHSVISNGLDSDYWFIDSNSIKEEKSFIAVFSQDQFVLKGGDMIVNIAPKFADYTFYIAGTGTLAGEIAIPENVIFLGKLSRDELRNYYRLSRFHLQLSIFEGFGLALCEAMLCECVPIGSLVNNIPDIIGSNGFIFKQRNREDLEELLNSAIGTSDDKLVEMGKSARRQVADNYSVERRTKELLSELEKRDK